MGARGFARRLRVCVLVLPIYRLPNAHSRLCFASIRTQTRRVNALCAQTNWCALYKKKLAWGQSF